MVTKQEASINKYFLYPSRLVVPEQPTLVTTLLGSCVAICLYDPVRKIGGINHYMLPIWDSKDVPTDKYGDISFKHLVDKMKRRGSKLEDLHAKVFGGANQGQSASGVGRKNLFVARSLLQEHRIDLVAKNTGGARGRKIIFNTESGEVKMWYLGNENQQQNG